MKRKHREWERIFTSSMCGGALISRVNKDLQNTKIYNLWRWALIGIKGGR